MKITLNNVFAIFNKEIKDVIRNPEVLLLFFVYPVIAVVLSTSISIEGMPEAFFISIFATMHAIFTPMVVTATILSEEKEKGTLRQLLMNNVSHTDYLLSIGGFVFIATMSTSFIFLFFANFAIVEIARFLLMISIGTLISILIGMSIGGFSKNQMATNGMCIPVAMFFAFLPMLSSFNEAFKSFSIYTYSGIISEMILSQASWTTQNMIVLAINALIFLVVFNQVFKKNRLDV